MPNLPPIHVDVGDRVLVAGDPRVHVVSWSSQRAWDAACESIIEDYQPDYYQDLIEVDKDAMVHRLTGTRGTVGERFYSGHPALQLQRASDDAPITCLVCFVRESRLADQRAEYDVT